jgi:hypothetical protein
MYAANATIGIQSHDQEFTNFSYNADFQGAVYAGGPGSNPATPPHAALAIQFKQWKNVVRVLTVSFQVPKRNGDTGFVDLPKGTLANNYELLLGNQILGVVRPVGIVQNVSSDVGPVNITQQPIQFNVIFRIRDLVNVNADPVYQKTATTRTLYPIYQETTTRHSRDTIIFDPYFTNASLLKQLGRFKAEVIATDNGPLGVSYGQRWPFDDTTGIRLFGISRQELPYINTFDDYDNSPEDGVIPSVKRWVSIGASVVDGDLATYNPPPPRGPQGILNYNSPVAKLDRRDNSGAFYNLDQVGVKGGDTLVSFPINLSTVQTQPVLVLSYERSGKNVYPRGWSDNIRFGPEHATYNTLKTAYVAGGTPDMMMVEFAEPSPNGIDNITNVQNWRDATFNDNAASIKWPGSGAPRWGVYGGGGGSLKNANTGAIDNTGKVIVDEFDAGKDFNFQHVYIPIPSRWTSSVNANKTFRFRLRVEAKSDKNPVGPPADDEDAFYVDNVMVIEPDKPELEVTSVGVDWPYTEAPASQARAIPLYARVSNNGSTASTAFGVSMFVQNKDVPPPTGQYSYFRYVTVLSLGAGQTNRVDFPTWNAQECGTVITPGPGTPAVTTTNYRVFGQLQQGYDSYSANDQTYTDFPLTLGPSFAYDDGSNDVSQFASLSGKGLNLVPATTQDGTAAQPYGPDGGSTSGSFAMQFRILTRDTVRGFKAYYGAANQSPDIILYQLYKQAANASLSSPPALSGAIKATRRYARRGEGTPDFATGNQYNFDQYVTYQLDTPYVVDPGIYFATVSQLAQTGLELGGDASRMGQVTTIRSDGPPPGIGNYSIPAYPEFNPAKPNGADRFWYEITAESGGWNPMLTTVGNPGYPHLTWTGGLPITTYTRGSWIPMIRPYFGVKASGACTVEPVELSSFEVTPLSTALRLDWTTASEMNNHGFHVERRVKGESENAWNQSLTFVPGAGTSNQAHEYTFTDEKVVANTTYQYRLRQEDRDGSVHYSTIKEGRLNGASTGAAVNSLSQNTPNPFSQTTQIGFTVAESGMVNLEIVDIYGKVVRGFTLDAKSGSGNTVVWDGRDAQGTPVPNGVYVYKLNGNGFSLSNKLTVTR